MPADDPVRQGDLLDGVPFPDARLPLDDRSVRGAGDVRVVKLSMNKGLVVSHCCDNESNSYAVIAQVEQHRPSGEQAMEAIRLDEPRTSLEGYDLRYFYLEPCPPTLLGLKEGSLWVANLQRTVTYYGDCSEFLDIRRARMTAQGRRLLRIKLGLMWGRVEAGDQEELEALGLPSGMTPPS